MGNACYGYSNVDFRFVRDECKQQRDAVCIQPIWFWDCLHDEPCNLYCFAAAAETQENALECIKLYFIFKCVLEEKAHCKVSAAPVKESTAPQVFLALVKIAEDKA